MTATDSSSPQPRVISVAYYIMSTLAVLSLIAIPWEPGGLIQGPLYLIVALGIRRERAWSAYGLALLTLVLTVVPIAGVIFGELSQIQVWSLAAAVLFGLAIVMLLFFAGRAIERRHGRRGMAWPWIAASVIVGGLFALFRPYQMPTGSMEDTMLIGDKIAVWRVHSGAPARGWIVVHSYPVDRKITFVKRVAGLPGDHVRIANKQLFINGVAVAEPYVEHKTNHADSYRDNFPSKANTKLYPGATEMLAKNVVNGEVVVPPGRYFVLGDNRDFSLDSRYWGFIEQSDIIGTPKFIYYSVAPGMNPEGSGSMWDPSRVRWGRIFRTLS